MRKILCLLLLSATTAFAAPNVANTVQKGTILMFPYVSDTTVLSISNDGTSKVRIRCEGVASTGATKVTSFDLLANRPALVSDVLPASTTTGYAFCFPVDAGETTQLRFNQLIGSATLYDTVSGETLEYNAWHFAARTSTEKNPIGTPGTLLLSGSEFDFCPATLAGHYQKGGVEFVGGATFNFGPPRLVILTCNLNTQPAAPAAPTRIVFDIWDELGVKTMTASVCVNRWGIIDLTSEFDFGGPPIVPFRYRARSVSTGGTCSGVTPTVQGMIGLQTNERLDVQDVSRTTVRATHMFGTKAGSILWPAAVVPESGLPAGSPGVGPVRRSGTGPTPIVEQAPPS